MARSHAPPNCQPNLSAAPLVVLALVDAAIVGQVKLALTHLAVEVREGPELARAEGKEGDFTYAEVAEFTTKEESNNGGLLKELIDDDPRGIRVPVASGTLNGIANGREAPQQARRMHGLSSRR